MRKKCEMCGGCGYIEIGLGLVAIQERYPELPMREIVDRGWLGSVDEENERSCDAAFLDFWGVASHDELREKWARHGVRTQEEIA